MRDCQKDYGRVRLLALYSGPGGEFISGLGVRVGLALGINRTME